MINSNNDITERIRSFILDHFPAARQRSLLDEDSLLESGVVDSLGVLEVVEFLESEFQITLSDDDLLAEHFETIASLADFVQARLNTGGSA
jgi:acyl carrier protein